MEIIGSIIGITFSLLFPPEISASPNSSPYELVQEYQTKRECQISIIDTDNICMTEPELYSGTRQYAKVPGLRETKRTWLKGLVKLEPNAISGYDDKVCKSISGCPVKKGVCPTCTKSKWYLMND